MNFNIVYNFLFNALGAVVSHVQIVSHFVNMYFLANRDQRFN